MFQFLLLSCCCITFSLTHNINIKVGRILKTHTAASYFGFSATGVVDNGVQPWLAVGSPRANTEKLQNVNNTGAFFKCPITMNLSDCDDKTQGTNRIRERNGVNIDSSNGWYGVSVAGGRKEDGSVMVCSHRPFVSFCGSNGDCTITLPGFCVVLRKSDAKRTKDITAIHLTNLNDFFTGRVLSYKHSGFGETGISAAVKGDTCYSGAVGDMTWKGSIIATGDTKYPAANQDYSYGGYSLATGSFFAAGGEGFAIGAPRHNLTGAVFVKDSLSSSNKKIIHGEQYSSYFGMAVCAGDFDGDQIFEIVVGAPYYTDSYSVPSIGKVYVYSSKNNFNSPVRTFESPKPQARALFGKAVAVIGDLDLSGHNDLVIGAPYQDEGGAVYIYHGSTNGLSEKPVQVIKASDFLDLNLKTFGWSVRGETDIDSNGYPDIVVGAYASDSVIILRSAPVVDVDVQYKLSSPTIDVSNKNCTVNDPVLGKTIQTVCFDVEVHASYLDRAGIMTEDIAISFELDADTLVKDTNEKRVRFEATQSPQLEVKEKDIAKETLTKVTLAKAYLRVDQCPDCEDKINPYPDIQLQVRAKVPKHDNYPPLPTSGKPPSLQPYFKLPYLDGENSALKNFTETKIKVKRACDPCKPNLNIANVGETKIPVQASDFSLEIMVGNTADQAYKVILQVDLPLPLRARPCDQKKCLSACSITNNASKMICDLGNFQKTAKQYKIGLDTSKASSSLETYMVTMNVMSDNKEDPSLLDDNSLSLQLKVASETDIEIRARSEPKSTFYGGSIRGQFSMTSQEQIGSGINHVYSVFNNGPNDVPEVNITIEWPYQTANGKRLLYLVNITGEHIDEGKAKCFPKKDWVNPLASQFTDDSSRVRRNVDERDSATPGVKTQQVRKGSASTVTLDCANKTAMCLSISCTLLNIKKTRGVDIIMESRIWNSTLLEDYTDRDVVVVSRGRIDDLTSYISDKNTDNHEIETTTTFYPDSPKTIKKDIATWIIVVSAIAGVVLLIILVVVFKMCGFFNRSGAQRYDAVPEN